MTVLPLCASCAYHARVIRSQVRLQEKRLEVNRPIDLTLIRKSREYIRSCSRCHPQEAS